MDPLRRLIDAVPRATLAESARRRTGQAPTTGPAAQAEAPRSAAQAARRQRRRSRRVAGASAFGEGKARQGRRSCREGALGEAAALSDAPWKLVAERLGINPAVAVDAYRHHRLPPGVSVEA